MTRRFAFAALPMVCVLLLAASPAAAAEEILKLVPESAWGFVVVNQPAAADAKLQALARQMQLPLPSPLTLLKQQFNMREGLDENGTMAMVVLPPEGDGPAPSPMLLIPVSDYGKFLQQLKPESTTQQVTKIEILHEPLWVRGIGGYAALSDISHREVLNSLKPSKEVPAALAAWRQWLAASDVAGVILPAGIKQASVKVQEGVRKVKASLPQADKRAKAAAAAFDMYAKMFQAAEKEVSACGFGLQLDQHNVLRVVGRASLKPGGEWARLAAQLEPGKENLLQGLPGGPFVLAGGGVMSDAMQEAMMKFSVDMIKGMRDLYGLSEKQADKLSEISTDAMKGCRAMSLMLGVGRSGEPIYSSAITMMRVDDARAFMAGYGKYLKRYSRLIENVQSPILQPIKIEKSKVGDTRGLQMTMKAPQLPAGQQTPHFAEMMETFMGPGGKIVGYVMPADEHRVVVGYVNKDRLQQAIAAIKQGAAGLAGDAEVSKTAALLPPDALSVAYVSPRGTIDFVQRIVPKMAPAEAKADLKLPEFPQTPPLGFAVTKAPGGLQTCLVVPAEVLQAVGPYIGKLRAMRGGAPPGISPPAQPPKQRVLQEPLTLDIARFYNMQENQKDILKPFSGRQVIDGLPFAVSGQARLWGQTIAERNPKSALPETLSAIRIGRTFDELHLIHHTIWPDVAGQTVAYISLSYADGTKSILPIRYGAQVRDWYFLPSYENGSPSDPDTKICWRHPPVMYKAPVRLFKSRLVNPQPQKVVETMDVVSARSLATYTLVAATVADRDPARPCTPPLAEEAERKFDGTLVIQVVDDATGKPIEGALVDPGMSVLGEGVVGEPCYTSPSGEATLRYPVKQTSSLSASVKKEGYRPDGRSWSRNVPSSYTFRLKPARSPAATKAAPSPSAAAPVPSRTESGIVGPWRVVSMVRDDQQLPQAKIGKLLLVFSEKTLAFRVDADLAAATPYTTDAKAAPATIDMTFNGQLTAGLYRRAGNDLRICLNDVGKGRPKAIPAALSGGCDTDLLLRRADLDWSALCVMSPDGSNPRALVTHPEYTSVGSPEWSWDCRKLAFDAWRSIYSETYSDAPHIFTCNADGTGLKDLGLGAMPSWSPDGKRLTFSCYRPSNAVWIMNVDGTGRELLDARGWSAEWWPKGDKIAYAYGGNVRVRDLGTGTSRDLLDDRYRQIWWGMAWSPDGQWLAFKGVTTDGKAELAVVHVDGMKNGFRVLLPKALPEANGVGQPFSWSPDSKQVLANLATKSNPVLQLYLIDADGQTPAKLLPGQDAKRSYTDFAWSPDGKYIAYCSRPNLESHADAKAAGLPSAAVSQKGGAVAVAKPGSVHVVAQMRTLPRENFSYIDADQDFVPIEVWTQSGDRPKWRVEKPGRVVLMDGASTINFMRPDRAYKLSQVTQGAFDTGPLLQLAEGQGMIARQTRNALAKGWDFKVAHETTAAGAEKVLLTLETKVDVPENDYSKDKWFHASNLRWVYRLDAKTERLEEATAYLHRSGGDVPILKTERIEYDQPIAPAVFALELPENVRWIKETQRLPDNEKYEKMTPLEAARAFFEACAKEDWDEAQKFDNTPFDERMKTHLGGLQIISLGEPFQSKFYPGWFIPYEIKFGNGAVRKHNLAMRKDNPARRYVVDGGL